MRKVLQLAIVLWMLGFSIVLNGCAGRSDAPTGLPATDMPTDEEAEAVQAADPSVPGNR